MEDKKFLFDVLAVFIEGLRHPLNCLFETFFRVSVPFTSVDGLILCSKYIEILFWF
jgi:hypothetical protein